MNCSCRKSCSLPPVQKYRATYPEKNAQFYSPVPPKSTYQKVQEQCRILDFKPTSANQCSSTFMPWDRPSPNECLKKCKGIDVYKMDGCDFEKNLYKTRINNNGCLREPSVMEYTNVAMIPPVKLGMSCAGKTKTNYPNVPSIERKDSKHYDPIRQVYGPAYSF